MKNKLSILAFVASAGLLATAGSAQPTLAWTGSTSIGSNARSIAWSPNGMQIVTARAISVKVVHAYNAGTGVQEWTYEFPLANDRVNDFAYSPDSSILYCFVRANSNNPPDGINNRVGRLNPTTGLPIGPDWVPSPSANSTGSTFGGVSLNAAGTRLAFAQIGNRVLTVYDTSDGSVIAQKDDLPGANTTNVSMSPSGSQLVVGTTGTDPLRAVHIYNVAPGSITLVGSSPDLGINPLWVEWAPNGSFIAARTATQIFKFDPNNITAPPVELVSGLTSNFNGMLAISPDSTKIGMTLNNSGVGVYSATDGSVIGTLDGLGITRPIAFSPDGSSVATANGTGSVFRVDGFGAATPTIGGSIFWEGPNSGPLPRLMVAWRTDNGNVVLPTVVIDVAPVNWQVRTVGELVPGPTDSLVWQNTDPGFSIPGLIAYWNLDTSGTPLPGGTGGAPPSIDWQVRAFQDLNGDGVSDILWLNTATDLVAIWYRNAMGDVIGTAVVGNVPSGWELVTAGTDNRLFFQNTTSTLVGYWTIDSMGGITGTTTVGEPGAGWVLEGFGRFNVEPALLFRNTGSNLLAYWDISASGSVIGTGTLGEAPAGWSVLGVGRL
ncbi:MAG: WD40 repeat domain-containing protein [Fimbriimonadaceae bacterium]